jgi:tight adherence protein C
VIAMVLLGAATGAVVFGLLVWVRPPRPSPLVRLARFDAIRDTATAAAVWDRPEPGETPSRRDGLGRWAAGVLARRGIASTGLRQDLALAGRSFEATMTRKVLLALFGFLLALVTVAALQVTGGFDLPVGSGLLVGLLVGAGFFLLPDVDAKAKATRRRRDFRRALGAWLDLVALEMAGSAAPAEALPRAARVGSGWPLAVLRDTLYRTTRAGRDQWEALTDLGNRIGVRELTDLGSLMRLVSHDGARARDTLTARARSIRRAELADAEGQAGKRNESMRVAQILIGFGFMVFLTYPAVVNVLSF